MPDFALILETCELLPHLEIVLSALSALFVYILWNSQLVWGAVVEKERERIHKPISAWKEKWGRILLFITFLLLGYGAAFFSRIRY